MFDQKGFSAVILILIILVLGASLLGGGYFYKTQYLNKTIDDTSNKTTQTTFTPQISPPASLNKLPLEGKVLFVSKKGNINFANPDGSNIVPFSSNRLFSKGEDVLPPRIVGISPDSSKFLFASYVKYNPSSPDDPDYKIGNSSAYYISSIDGKDLKKIDLTKFAKLGISMVIFSGWSSDGGKIVFSGLIPQPPGPAKSVFGDYDPVSEETRLIYSSDSPKAGMLKYYDAQNEILIFNSQLPGNADPTGRLYKINLRTNQVEEFNRPNLEADNYNSYTPYYISSPSDFSATDRKKIIVYSYAQPNNPISEINVDDPKSDFSNGYQWSSNYNYFAIGSGYSEKRDNKIEFHRKLNIYTKEGKKVLSQDLTNFNYYSGSQFSPDETKFLMVGITTQKDGPKIDIPIWQVLDVKTGDQLSDRVVSEDLGLETVKWLR
jgi:hypothetical protein